jgi:dihydrofolate reductase
LIGCGRSGISGFMPPPLFRLYLAVSVDGFIAPPDGGVDWLEPYPPEEFGFPAFIETIGTIVMGRTTFDQTLRVGPWPFSGKRTIVLTSRVLGDAPPGVETWTGDIGPLAANMKAGRTRDVWLFGGAKSARPFLERSLVDRLELYVIPVLLGNGLPLFERSNTRTALRLETVKPRAKGVLEVVYAALHQN